MFCHFHVSFCLFHVVFEEFMFQYDINRRLSMDLSVLLLCLKVGLFKNDVITL